MSVQRLFGARLWSHHVPLLGLLWAMSLPAQEFRALWVDAFHTGFKSATQVDQLIADARAGHFNALLVEVRKRGDAYYNSHFEPRATEISSSFDPLTDLITKAHNTNTGPRIEIHAWIVTFNIWNQETNRPPQSNHPYNLHPDWLTQDINGTQWDGDNFAFDPGHPEVQRHTFDVAMDIVANYDIDGFNLDYIRYAGNTWGYNPVAVARFNDRFGRSGQPASTDPDWLQFRRDQVTSLVRKIYLSAIALKPRVKISADTITWAPGITTDTAWTNSTAAYKSVLQDWRAWMEEGILDLNLPMAYFRQHTVNSNDWDAWSTFAKNHRYRRHVAIGPGIYLNYISNVLFQIRDTRQTTVASNTADGVIGYSYYSNSITFPFPSRSNFYAALTLTNVARLYDPNPTPVFALPADPPVMRWKTEPTKGHLKGFVTFENPSNWVDGAILTLTGPVSRSGRSDATGFYGFVDLPPGSYTVSATISGQLGIATKTLPISTGIVAHADLIIYEPPRITLQPASQTVTQGLSAQFTTAAVGSSPLGYCWQFNGNAVSNSATNRFSITNIQYLHTGAYSVIVTNPAGSVSSTPAQLSVLPARPAEFQSILLLPDWQVKLSLTGATGFPYGIEASSNLTLWTPLLTNDIVPFDFIDSPITNHSRRFYRAIFAP